MTKLLNGLLLITILAAGLGTAVAQSCDAIAKYGIYDYRLKTSESQRASSFRNWFCQSNFNSSQEASSVGVSIGIPIGDIPVALGFDSKKQSFASWKGNYCSEETSSTSTSDKTYEFEQSINAKVVESVEKCINSAGLNAWIESGSDPKLFYFTTRFVSSGSTVQAIVQHFVIDPNGAATCTPMLEAGKAITAAGQEISCTRYGDGAIQISFQASEQLRKITPLSLPPIIRFPKQSPASAATTIQFHVQENLTKRTHVAVGGIPIYGDVMTNYPAHELAPNMAEWSFPVQVPGRYALEIEYAALDPRPITITLNGSEVSNAGLSAATGGWFIGNQKFVKQLVVNLVSGINVLRFSSPIYFPHIRTIKFTPTAFWFSNYTMRYS